MAALSPIIDDLNEAQSTFLRIADAFTSDQWMRRPEPQRWCAAEIVAHLVAVELAVVGGADRIMQRPLKSLSFMERRHLPIWLVRARLVKRKSPLPLDPSLVRDKEEALAELRAARERTLAFLEETRKRDLRPYCWRHAFLGMLNVYEWFELIAAHEIRHGKQLREILKKLPKPVTSAENR